MYSRLAKIITALLLILSLSFALASCDVLPDEIKDMLGITEEEEEKEASKEDILPPDGEKEETEDEDPAGGDEENGGSTGSGSTEGSGDPENNGANDVPLGNKVGDRCHDGEITLVGSNGSVKVSSLLGKVVVINFWGTWCTPCVAELPHFDSVAEEYSESVAVIAIHSSFDSAPLNSYVAQHYSDSSIIFAKDAPTDDNIYVDKYYSLLGGRGNYPLTLVIKPNGVISYKTNSAISYDGLVAAVEAAGAIKDICTHESAEWVTSLAATCKSTGTEQLKCKGCESVLEEREIPKLTTHTPKSEPAIEDFTDSTCADEGSYNSVTYCSVCDIPLTVTPITVERKPHTPASEPVIEDFNDSTCDAEGSYNLVTYCSLCPAVASSERVTVEKKAHTPAETWTIESEPTCKTEGSQYKECTVCHKPAETEAIPTVDHSYVSSACVWCARPEPTPVSKFSFIANKDGTVYVSKYYGSKISNVVIPEYDGQGRMVTGIGTKAFYEKHDIQTLYIPDTVTTISDNALQGMGMLTSVRMSSSLKSFGYQVFRACGWLSEITIDESAEHFVSINGALYTKGEEMELVACPGRIHGEIAVAEGTVSIRKYVFYDYGSTNSYFYQLSLPSTLRDFSSGEENEQGEKDTYGRLTSITVSADNPVFFSHEGVLYKGDTLVLYPKYRNVSTYTVVPGTKVIGCRAFNTAYGVSSVTLPDGLLRIEEDAFSYCGYLSSINIPSSVTYIGKNAFLSSTKVGTVVDKFTYLDGWLLGVEQKANTSTDISQYLTATVADGTVGIASGAFSDLSRLASVSIPASVKYIGKEAFHGCKALNAVSFGENSQLTKIEDNLFSGCNNLRSITIPASVTEIGKYAFDNVPISAVNIPIGVTKIAEGAFQNTKITSLTLHSGITHIGDYAFYGCKQLESVNFRELTSLEHIGMGAFGYTKISSLYVPASVKYIGLDAFNGCDNLSGSEGEIIFEITSGWTCIHIETGVAKSMSEDSFTEHYKLFSYFFNFSPYYWTHE